MIKDIDQLHSLKGFDRMDAENALTKNLAKRKVSTRKKIKINTSKIYYSRYKLKKMGESI